MAQYQAMSYTHTVKLGKWDFASALDLKCLFLHLTGISLVDAPCQAASSTLGKAPSQLKSQCELPCLPGWNTGMQGTESVPRSDREIEGA